jgi:hypothetical protein
MGAFAFLLIGVPIAADAQPETVSPAKLGAACLRQDMVWGWKVVDDRTLIVTDKVQKTYKVSLKPGCYDLKWPLHLGFKSFNGFGLSCLTHNDYVIVPPQAGMPAQRCFISNVTAYTPMR